MKTSKLRKKKEKQEALQRSWDVPETLLDADQHQQSQPCEIYLQPLSSQLLFIFFLLLILLVYLGYSFFWKLWFCLIQFPNETNRENTELQKHPLQVGVVVKLLINEFETVCESKSKWDLLRHLGVIAPPVCFHVFSFSASVYSEVPVSVRDAVWCSIRLWES